MVSAWLLKSHLVEVISWGHLLRGLLELGTVLLWVGIKLARNLRQAGRTSLSWPSKTCSTTNPWSWSHLNHERCLSPVYWCKWIPLCSHTGWVWSRWLDVRGRSGNGLIQDQLLNLRWSHNPPKSWSLITAPLRELWSVNDVSSSACLYPGKSPWNSQSTMSWYYAYPAHLLTPDQHTGLQLHSQEL